MNPIQYKTNKISKKQVYYEGADSLKEGYLLCYNWDATLDLDGDTIAEGSQNSGKYLRVEKPTTTNAKFVAGVVSAESAGKIGPCWITIIELSEAIVPVYTNANSTGNSTILYVTNASYFGTTSGAYVFGIAIETIDRSVINGLVLVKPRLIVAVSAAVSDSLLSVEVTLKSDRTATESNYRADLDSDEKVLSDATYAVDSELVVLASVAKTLGSNANVAASDVEVIFAADPNYSDVPALASDLRTIFTTTFSQFAADISNFAVRVSDKLG